MSVRLRLKRIGMPKQPYYRIVAIERTRARNGKEIEVIGHFDPRGKGETLKVNAERANHWLSCGALASDTVHSLFLKAGVIGKKSVKAEAKKEGQDSAN